MKKRKMGIYKHDVLKPEPYKSLGFDRVRVVLKDGTGISIQISEDGNALNIYEHTGEWLSVELNAANSITIRRRKYPGDQH